MLADITTPSGRAADPTPLAAVMRYAAAKSRQDVEAALAECTDQFVLDTVAFGLRGVGATDVAAQLRLFFATFPDYRVEMAGHALADDEETVACWGTLHATMRGALGSFAATDRACTLPFVCVFELCGDRLAAERFFFDLGTMCEALGLPLDAVTAELRAFRAATAATTPADLWRANGRAPHATNGAAPTADSAGDVVARFTRFWTPPVDLDDLETLLHPDARLIAPGMETTVGRAAGIAAFRQVFAMVPDLHIDVERWSASGDAIFLEVTMRGTIDGRALAIPSVDRLLVRDGMVLERVAYFDPAPMVAALSAPA